MGGLIGWWDGIWNAGPEQHTDSENEMVDLVTGAAILVANWCGSIRNTELPNYEIVGNGLRSYTDEKDVGIGIPLSACPIGGRRVFTIEAVRTIHVRKTPQTPRGLVVIGPNTTSNTFGNTLTVPYSGQVYNFYSGQWSIGSLENKTGLNTYSIASDSKIKRVAIINGTKKTSIYQGQMNVVSGATHIGFGTGGYQTTLHALRVYNRALSDDEILWNQNTDKKRFGSN